MPSIKKHFKHTPVQEEIELKRMFTAIVADIAALRAEVVAIAAQLDTDTGVNGTDFNTLTGGTPTVTD